MITYYDDTIFEDTCSGCNRDCKECESNIEERKLFAREMREEREDVFQSLAGITNPLDPKIQESINKIEFAALRIEEIIKTL